MTQVRGSDHRTAGPNRAKTLAAGVKTIRPIRHRPSERPWRVGFAMSLPLISRSPDLEELHLAGFVIEVRRPRPGRACLPGRSRSGPPAMPPSAAATATWVPSLPRLSRRLLELIVARQPDRWPMPVVLGRPQGVEQASGAGVVDRFEPLDGSGPVVVIEDRGTNCARNHGVHTLEAGMATPRTRWRSAGLPPFYIGTTSNPSRVHRQG